MTALWLWLNSTELNWTLNVLVVSENCFAFALFLRFSITSVSLFHSLATSRSLSGNLALLLNFWFSEQPRFLYRTLNSDGRLVSQWLRTHTQIQIHWERIVYLCVILAVVVLVLILLSLPISNWKSNSSLLSISLSAPLSLSLSLCLLKTTTLRSTWIQLEFPWAFSRQHAFIAASIWIACNQNCIECQ